MALTSNRITAERNGVDFSDPVAAAKIIFLGAIVVLDAAGDASAGVTGLNLKARGIAQNHVDNSGGIAGAQHVETRKGTFILKNDGSINRTHIDASCYIVDDETVAATDGAGTRSIAGTIKDVSTAGVHVHFA